MDLEEVNEQIVKDALRFAQKKKLAVVSTVAANGIPESAMILFYLDSNFNFYFITRTDSRKVQNLATNKNISVVIGTELGVSTLQMSGIADSISGEGQKEFIENLAKDIDLSALFYGPFLNIAGINFTLYKVKINWARWLTLDIAHLKEVYYQIIPHP